VLRCDLDGSNMEVIHVGLRNPQELAFDDHGNLFTCDNNSDSGDRVRWVYVVEGGDSGWRCGYQYGTGYHTPAVPQGNRGPFNTEKLWLPHFEGQAAYIVPPLLNFGNGPSGIAYYPGVGFNDKYKGHFFVTDFTGGPGGNSAIWTLSVKPKGAAFEVSEPQRFIRNMLPTDCEFGPDGAFYWSDWINGWDKPGRGRIFRVTDPEAMKNPQVAEAQKLLSEGFEKKTIEELVKLLEFPHQKVRQEAQFELASRKPAGAAVAAFVTAAQESRNQVARLQTVWGLGMIAREHPGNAWGALLALAKDADPEVKRAAVEQLGQLVTHSRNQFLPPQTSEIQAAIARLLTDPDPRVQAAAAVAYGKIGPPVPVTRTPLAEQAFVAPLFDMLKANNDKRPVPAARGPDGAVSRGPEPGRPVERWTQAKAKYDHPAVRMGVLLALRKHTSDKVAEFLADDEPRIVAEAARAIYDERLMNAFPALAKLAEKPGQPDAIAFRALAANLWLGQPQPIAQFRRPIHRTRLHPGLRAQAAGRLGRTPAGATRSPASRWTSASARRRPPPRR
jgi:quinoprotein glucose dehydrogenase